MDEATLELIIRELINEVEEVPIKKLSLESLNELTEIFKCQLYGLDESIAMLEQTKAYKNMRIHTFKVLNEKLDNLLFNLENE